MESESFVPASERPLGATRLGEWLLVDIRITREIQDGPVRDAIMDMASRGAAGAVSGTLIVDLLEATSEQRALLLREFGA